MRQASLASRLSAIYATLLGITVVLVIVASSIALVIELTGFTGDIVIAKHEEARILTEQYRIQGLSLQKAAPDIVNALSGIGLRVTVYDKKGRYLAGDKTLRPRVLDRIIAGAVQLLPPPSSAAHLGQALEFRVPPLPSRNTPKPPPGGFLLQEGVTHAPGPTRPEPFAITAVDGGYVAFSPSLPLLLMALMPYWRVVVTIAIGAMLLSWFVGRMFAGQSLRPLSEVTESLRALANGDFTQRRFVGMTGDEIGTLSAAYNDAAAHVAASMDERRQTEQRMRQFVADAGHELRTPLTVIGGYIDVLRRGAIEEPTIARQILQTMGLEKEHMRVLIDRLMRLARLDSETPPNRESIDLCELLRSQVDAAKRLDHHRSVDYSVDGGSTIVGDRIELGEALWNVVENALKYAPEAPVHLRASQNNGNTTITVRDEGPGMSESERMHAFERFYRGDQRGEIAGTGLGLAIAKRAVERAGGRIVLDSSPGIGTTVTITL